MKNDENFNNIPENKICPFCNSNLTKIVYGRYDKCKLNKEK